jgi:hypothetical protein
MKTVYLAGKITGDQLYYTKFYEATKVLEEAGFVVLSGIRLPGKGFTWDQYMRITAAMLEECEAACFLPDWKESRGATYEFGEAVAKGKDLLFLDDGNKTLKQLVAETQTMYADGREVNKRTVIVEVDVWRAAEVTEAGTGVSAGALGDMTQERADMIHGRLSEFPDVMTLPEKEDNDEFC